MRVALVIGRLLVKGSEVFTSVSRFRRLLQVKDYGGLVICLRHSCKLRRRGILRSALQVFELFCCCTPFGISKAKFSGGFLNIKGGCLSRPL